MCETTSHTSSRNANPVLVEVTRGGIVESQHRGAFCVVNDTGEVIRSQGDIDQPVFPRSSIKAIQALGLIESGAADTFGFSKDEIAITCASHGGEVMHVSVVQSMLHKMGLTKELLQCGAHWPMHEPAGRHLAMEGETPSALHNNCSGKHAGFLAVLKQLKISPIGYCELSHPLQQSIQATLEELCEVDLSQAPIGIDGCSIPTWALPLKNLALGFSKFAKPQGRVSAEREIAIKRLSEAVFASPYMVAGTGRYCTRLMEAFAPRVFVKTGAEGVFCAFVPKLGYGIAVKCDDGATRGAETILSAILEDLGVISKAEFYEKGVGDLHTGLLKNRQGKEVGLVRRSF
jgi:L-asparaginase II